MLPQLDLFNGFSQSQLELMTSLFADIHYSAEEEIFKQGETSEYLYVVIKGNVAIRFKPYDGEMITVTHIKKNGVFGWSSAFGNDHYTSGAIASPIPICCACAVRT